MALREYFPATAWVVRTLTGRVARRVYLAIVALMLLASAVARVRTFMLTRKMHAVIQGLSKLRIDETSEDEVLRTVPYLVRSDWNSQVKRTVETGMVDEGIERVCYVKISNQRDWMAFENFAERFSSVEYAREGPKKSWMYSAANLLGYRYVGFAAAVIFFNGKVSRVSYGIANVLVLPESAADAGDVLSVKSIHARWAIYRQPFGVSSTLEQSPEFSVGGDDARASVLFTPEAAPEMASHAFHVNLSCFWGLSGCCRTTNRANSLARQECDRRRNSGAPEKQ